MRRHRILISVALIAGALALATVLAAGPAADDPAAVTGENAPRYTAEGELMKPEGWEEWIFVGASVGLSYSDQATPGMQHLHHVYLSPEAYAGYAATGKFPEGTMLVLELYHLGEQVAPSKSGLFAGERIAVEVALKDSKRFPDQGWAYYDFSRGKTTSTPFASDRCYSCHSEHAQDDNVFVQFYPVLRRLKETG